MTAPAAACSADVYVGPSTWLPCRKAAGHIEDGRRYCGTHAPSLIAVRAHARSLVVLAEAARIAAFQREQAAAALAAHIEAWIAEMVYVDDPGEILAWCRQRCGATTEVVEK